MSFTVFVDDNYHFDDDGGRYHKGDYESLDEAISVCEQIVEDFLQANHKPGMTAEALYEKYRMFGEAPYIVPMPETADYSSREYARQRCMEICSE